MGWLFSDRSFVLFVIFVVLLQLPASAWAPSQAGRLRHLGRLYRRQRLICPVATRSDHRPNSLPDRPIRDLSFLGACGSLSGDGVAMIEVAGFGKTYGNELAVVDLHFQVAPGQVVGLVGPNGAGKTTTLRALTGIVTPSAGRLAVDGFDVETQPLEVKHRTAYVADDPQLFGELTVWQHLEFTAGVYNLADWNAAAEDLLSRFELQGKRHAAASELSRGMRQKLAICCAYLHHPTALLLDEPMTGLDPRGIRALKQSVAEHAARGAAVIISSHLLAVVEELCSHVVILHRGRRRFWGSLDELRTTTQAGDGSLEDIFFHTVGGDDVLVESLA